MPLLYEKRGHVGTLTFSRPEARNAWCAEFHEGLLERLPELERDDEIRCVILTGDERGGAFSAGARFIYRITKCTNSSPRIARSRHQVFGRRSRARSNTARVVS